MTERGALLGGRYELDQVIGRGGMAEVWRARDLRLERDVAVKRLRVDLASDPTFQARFRREAQSAAGLNHPNIVAVYDTGEERDASSDISVPFIVMELVEGVTLREVLRDGRKIVPERALEFTAGVLDALAYSHRAGIIHRDIKPANVMLTPNGTVKVMDFGIARAVADTSATMTQTAAVIGTAQYLSPEQARGEKVDNRSDIYSVGCLLYELLTSQPLFKGDSPVSVAYQHVREIPVPPSHVDPEVTAPMDAIVLKSLEKDPRDRYQDASEMREDILRSLNGQPVLASLPTENPTQVIPSDPMTTTARRGMAPVPAAAPSPALSPVRVDEVRDTDRRSNRGVIALAIIAGLILIAMGVALWSLLNPPEPVVETVAVPTVVGQTQLAAENLLTDKNLVPDVTFEAGTDENKGLVLDSDPDSGELVEPGSTVTLVVSSGPDVRTVPDDLTGIPVAEARRLLETAGLTNVTEEDADPATEPIDAVAGNVVSVNPASGATVAPDREIVLQVATGTSVVVRLTDRTLSAARDEAEAAGFTIEAEEVETDEVSPGLVFDQNEPAGAVLERSTVIKVKVAVAPPEPEPPVVTVTATPSETPTPDPTPSETPSTEPDPSVSPSTTP
ncbi:Stk1 family PASTA domain-containing Ser/Thr kinase [Tessaracoccus sp. Z1128]